MFFICGGRDIKRVLGEAERYTCSHCQNTNSFIITRIRSWLTVFFIPVIPCRTRYFIVCPICEYGKQLTKKEANEKLEQKF